MENEMESPVEDVLLAYPTTSMYALSPEVSVWDENGVQLDPEFVMLH